MNKRENLDLEIYREHKKMPIEPPIICIVSRRKIEKKKSSTSELFNQECQLIHTSGLAFDKTIIFIAQAPNGERFAVNEKSII